MGLRKVERLIGDTVEVVKMIDLKAGDIYRLYEGDGELVGTFKAVEDATTGHNGVAQVLSDPVASE